MKRNCLCKASLFIAIITTGVLRAAAQTATKSEPETIKLFARESQITVGGKTAKVTAITQSNGELVYSP